MGKYKNLKNYVVYTNKDFLSCHLAFSHSGVFLIFLGLCSVSRDGSVDVGDSVFTKNKLKKALSWLQSTMNH